jgi:hypothetical protein
MKNIIKTTCIFIFALLLCNCDDRLEEILPEDSLSEAVIFSNFSTIEAATVGVYDAFQNGNIEGGAAQFVGDFMADDANFVGSFTGFQDVRDFNSNSTTNEVFNIWGAGFGAIRAANIVIVNLPNVDINNVNFNNPADFDTFEQSRLQFIAEARFCRAIANFTLVNLFAQPFQVSGGANLGIPLVEDFFTGDITPFQLPRSSVNDVHDFIEADLLNAITNLPTSNGVRASKASAQGLLSRLYLYREQWGDAATMANNAINAPGSSLATNLNFYNSSSSEHLFQVINLPDDPAGGSRFDTFYNPQASGGRGDLPFTQDLIDAYEAQPGDLRYTSLTIISPDAGTNPTATFTTKYPNGNTGESDSNTVRVAEMYLNRAEANFRGGTTIGDTPLNDVNAIRQRAGLAALTTLTLNDILLERRKELAFEGHRRMDLLRNGRNLRPGGGALSAVGADKTILGIPSIELDNNPNMEQNPGY